MQVETTDTRTLFAPAWRATEQEVQRQAQHMRGLSPMLRPLVDGVPSSLVALNQARQIILANQALLTYLGKGEDAVLGRRLGEALDCIHANEQPSGCGCSEACSTCGAVRAMLASQSGRADVQECRITRASGDALDLRVRATPFPLGEDQFIIFAFDDISHEKRRRALERVFFHDVLNTATGIRVSASLLRNAPAESADAPLATIANLMDRLIEEIEVQRQLTAAESGELVVKPVPVDITSLLYEVAHLYGSGDSHMGPHVVVEVPPKQHRLISDKTLLRRVVGNMLKNAVEASRPADTVTIGCIVDEQAIEFWVHNPGFIAREVQLQLFQRSFSTKGSSRGLGTYSVRLLTERYLDGSVSFTSSVEEGTIFRARYPLVLTAE